MPTAVIMPKFEMAQETGKVATWLKAEGDAVKKGEAILEVETDKVNLEVEATVDGILMGISARPGDVVPIGQTIAYLLKPGETLPDASPTHQPLRPPAGQPAVDSARPVQSTTGEVAHGVSASPLAARLAESLGVDVASIKGSGPRGQVTREDVEAYVAAQTLSTAGSEEVQGMVRAVPAARRVARELGIDLRTVVGTGPEGRIQSDDVRTHFEGAATGAKAAASAAEPVSTQPEPPPALAAFPGSPAVRRLVPLTNIRRTIAERMTASVRDAPQFTVSLDADMTRALAIVEDLRTNAAAAASASTSGGQARLTPGDQPRVTLTTLLIKASAWALCQHPEANAAYQDGQIAEWDEVNVGVATAIEAGLIVPVIRQADRLGMREIAARLGDLTTRARENRLKIEDLQGGTFTVSNLGMFGIDQFTAILNPPQAAILAVGRVAKRAVVTADDRVEVRPITTLTLTADHRVLDGATAARFLATLQRVLEHPGLLME